ncbi:MAG: VWA domain-containing protein [Terracidiphilus sp.]|jgi:VWFA-related protein
MRRRRFVFSLASFCLILLSFQAIYAQDNPVAIQSGRQGSTAVSLNGKTVAPAPATTRDRIHLDVVVSDKSGRPISGLDLKDFTLLDDNQPAKILSFQAIDENIQKANPPAEIILVIDAVNFGFQQVAFTRQEIERFLRQNGGHLAQPVSIFVLTNQGVDVRRQPSVDGNALAAEVSQLDNKLRTISSSAGGWGAIERFEFSIRILTSIAKNEARKPGRKLLIWAGSGWPMLDVHNIESTSEQRQQYFDSIVELSTKLREARISVYSISSGQPGRGTFLYQDFLKPVKLPEKASPPNLALRVLAVQSGGRVRGPDNDLSAQIDRCVQDASTYYTLSFDPPRADHANEYHELKVQIDKPGLTALTNTGYYNQP